MSYANFTNQFAFPDGFDRFLGIINILAPVDRLVNSINNKHNSSSD